MDPFHFVLADLAVPLPRLIADAGRSGAAFGRYANRLPSPDALTLAPLGAGLFGGIPLVGPFGDPVRGHSDLISGQVPGAGHFGAAEVLRDEARAVARFAEAAGLIGMVDQFSAADRLGIAAGDVPVPFVPVETGGRDRGSAELPFAGLESSPAHADPIVADLAGFGLRWIEVRGDVHRVGPEACFPAAGGTALQGELGLGAQSERAGYGNQPAGKGADLDLMRRHLSPGEELVIPAEAVVFVARALEGDSGFRIVDRPAGWTSGGWRSRGGRGLAGGVGPAGHIDKLAEAAVVVIATVVSDLSLLRAGGMAGTGGVMVALRAAADWRGARIAGSCCGIGSGRSRGLRLGDRTLFRWWSSGRLRGGAGNFTTSTFGLA